MKLMERNVMRLAAVQHLRTAYGIKIKNWNKNKAISCKLTGTQSVKVFGVPLENLPQYTVEHESVPVFLVDACGVLLEHIDTEGLFRKSGSIVRLKALRAKLDGGEECLYCALPCDVACLLKQFFRELPEPALPAELQEAFLRAQQLGSLEDRTAATLLVACVLPDRNLAVLRYFCSFLLRVSQRSAENKMDGSNLSVILAPNLLHGGGDGGAEKMNSATERRLKLQAAVVHCLIEHAQDVGVVPPFLLERLPAMMGGEAGVLSPSLEGLEELDHNSGMKRRRRRSLGVFSSSSATPVIATPSSKRKLPLESGQSYGFSNKKRRSMKKSLGIELLPNSLFGANSTPGSAYSASGVLEGSHATVSPATRSAKQPATSARRKSRRLSNRHPVSRVESGKAGCFSPKVTKKEAVRKSLRLRFSLGKSSREAGTEAIGWRLATQDSISSLRPIRDKCCSPAPLRNQGTSKNSKYISQSEDNLLSPQCDPVPHRTSWSGDTPGEGGSFTDTPMSMVPKGGYFSNTPLNMGLKGGYFSEPAIVHAKLSAATGRPTATTKLCCASSTESLLERDEGSFTNAPAQTGPPTLLKIKTAVATSSGELQAGGASHDSAPAGQEDQAGKVVNLFLTPPSESPSGVIQGPGLTLPAASAASHAPSAATPQRRQTREHDVPFSQLELVPLTPLHINSTLFDAGGFGSPAEGAREPGSLRSPDTTERLSHSRLIDALDIQSPAHFHLGVSSGVQSTPYRASDLGLGTGLQTPLPGAAPAPGMVRLDLEEEEEEKGVPPERGATARLEEEEQLSPGTLATHRPRVADHIQRFNKLTLYSPTGRLPRSPLKFQRTPVRQSVRRINSLLGDRRAARTPDTSSHSRPVGKTVSLESGLSAGAQLKPYQGEEPAAPPPAKRPPPVPPKKTSTLLAKQKALGDVTNKLQAKPRDESSGPGTKAGEAGDPRPSAAQQVAERDMSRYRGSPRNPLNAGRLLSATKPIDL